MRDLKFTFIELVFSWWVWTKHMCCFHVVETWICTESVRLWRPRKCEVIPGVNLYLFYLIFPSHNECQYTFTYFNKILNHVWDRVNNREFEYLWGLEFFKPIHIFRNYFAIFIEILFGHKWTNHRIISSTIKFHAGVIFDLWTGYHSFGDQSSHFHHNFLRCTTGDGFLVFSIKPSLKEQSFELHDFIGRIIGS